MIPTKRSLFGLPFVALFGGAAYAQPSGTNTNPLSPGQYPGTNTNSNAVAGNIGEFTSIALALASALAVTTNVGTAVLALPLTAGDWDVWGQVVVHPQTATVIDSIVAGIITTASNTTFPGLTSGAQSQDGFGAGLTGASGDTSLGVGPSRISLAAAGTAFLLGLTTFATSTAALYGVMRARRVR
jgi:hypothetical protein